MKSCILLAGTGVRKNSNVACGFSPIKTHYFDYPKRLIKKINEAYFSDIFIENTLTSSITVCFAGITLVIAIAWFM